MNQILRPLEGPPDWRTALGIYGDDAVLLTGTVNTTNATQTTLMTTTLATGALVSITGSVTAKRTGGSSGASGDGAYYELATVANNVAGTAALIGQAQPVTLESQAGWACVFDATGATVRVRVTGAANNDVTWQGAVVVTIL